MFFALLKEAIERFFRKKVRLLYEDLTSVFCWSDKFSLFLDWLMCMIFLSNFVFRFLKEQIPVVN